MALLNFFNFLEAEMGSNLNEPADRLTSILKTLVAERQKKLDRRVLNAESRELGLFSDDNEQP
jgi:hypothetical protein